jgi:hypothetical protein
MEAATAASIAVFTSETIAESSPPEHIAGGEVKIFTRC